VPACSYIGVPAAATVPSSAIRSVRRVQQQIPRLQIEPCAVAAILALERELKISHAFAQVLVRRGLGNPDAARAFLEAGERHDPSDFAGIHNACALMLRHAEAGTRITVHGDYDVDGVSATAILVGVLRTLGAGVDWFLPSRSEDGYGLSAATVARLVQRGTGLLITADCAITAVDEVAAARVAGLDVVVTDHHSPRADGRLPDAHIVHPAVCGYPCPDLCAAGVAYKLAAALLAASGRDPADADADLDLVALATVADCVPLRGENRRLVRAGLRALATTTRPGLRALMRVARADPSRIDARAVGFRLAPRINAAGRLERADAGLELLLTTDEGRAKQIAGELDRLNAERRHTETRILFEAEAHVAQAGDRPAYVLAGAEWHKGVIGIVASRIAERHHRPTVLIALDGDRGTGSGRSIPAYDLLAGLDAASAHLLRHGGHRAAAGCEVQVDQIDAFRAAFEAHAAATLGPEDLTPVRRVDAVVAGDELGVGLAEELERLAPFGIANPEVSLLVPAARLSDPRTMGEGKHVRFTVGSGGVRARAVAFGMSKVDCEQPVDATFSLELNEYHGSVEPRLVLRDARPCHPPPIKVVGEPENYLDAVLEEVAGPLDEVIRAREDGPRAVDEVPPARDEVSSGLDEVARPLDDVTNVRDEVARASSLAPVRPAIRERRGGGIAGTIAALVATGETVLVVGADAALRARHLAPILGGFQLCSHDALERDPSLARPDAHVVLLDPPAGPVRAYGRVTHLAWGPDELRLAEQIHERDYALRGALTVTYRALRAAGGATGSELEELLRGDAPTPRPARLAARVLRVLAELDLVRLDAGARSVIVPPAERTALERSAAFRHYACKHEEGRPYFTDAAARAA